MNIKGQSTNLSILKELFDANKYLECSKLADSLITYKTDKTDTVFINYLFMKGLIFDKLNKLDQSEKYLTKALGLAFKLDSQSILSSDIQNRLGYILFDMNRVSESEKHLKNALKIRENLLTPNDIRLAETHYFLARIYTYNTIDASKVIDHANKAIDIYNKQDNPPSKLIRSIMMKGVALYQQDKLSEAKTTFDNALRLSNKFPNDKKVVINLYLNIGNYFQRIDDNNTALNNYNKALNLSLKINGKNHYKTNSILSNIAIVKRNLELFDEAIEINRNILKSNIELYGENDIEVAHTYNDIGNTYSKMKDDKNALKYYKQAEKIFLKTLPPNSFLLAINYLNLGESYANIKKYEEALSSVNKTLQIATKILEPDHILIAACHYYIGGVLAETGNFKKAMQEFEITKQKLGYGDNDLNKIKYLSKAADLQFLIAYTYSKWFDSIKNRKYLEKADENNNIAFQIIEKARNSFESQGSEDYLMIRYRTSFENTLLNLYKLGAKDNFDYADKMFYIMDYVKNNQLNDGVVHNKAIKYGNIPDSIRQKEQAFVETKLSLKHRLEYLKSFGLDSINKATETEVDLAKHNESYKKFLLNLETKYPNYYNLIYNKKNIDIEFVQKHILSDDEAMISYFIDKKYIFCLSIEKRSFFVDTIGLSNGLYDEIKTYPQVVHSPNNNKYENLSNKLYKDILENTLNNLPKNINKIIIVPDGILGYIPFESLIYDIDKKIFLNEIYTIRYAYSAKLLNEQNNINVDKDKMLAAFAPKYRSFNIKENDTINDYAIASLVRAGEYELPGSQKEVKIISKIIPSERFSGDLATVETFKKVANDFSILHLSMHAIVDHQRPLNSKLLFTEVNSNPEKNYLHSYELYGMKINANMVVLSACNTGIGNLKNGEGIMSLNRAFTYSGVSSTVMSLWKIPDDATSEIMTSFYKHLKKGDTKSTALQNAKKDYLKNTIVPERKNPFYWSGFVLVGNDSPINIDPGIDYRYVIFAVIFAIFAFLFIRRKFA